MRGRILGLDPGTRRMGLAMSDEMGLFAQPLETYRCRSPEADLEHVRMLVARHGVQQVVVGLPIQLNGRPGPAVERVQAFIEQLRQTLTVPVVAWDERMTSKAAERVLIEADLSRQQRKGTIDRVAAALMLQSYLDYLAYAAEPAPPGRPDEKEM